MICQHCGTNNLDDAKFCIHCGNALAAASPAAPVQPTYEPAATPEQPVYTQPPMYNQVPYGQTPYPQVPVQPNPDEGKSFAVASLVLGIFSLICCAVIAGPLGIIFGAIAKSKGYRGGMATAGIICGAIGVGLWLIMIVISSLINLPDLLSMLSYY